MSTGDNFDGPRAVSPQPSTEEKILQAAMDVFARCPFQQATLRMVAKQAEVTHPLLLYHFKTKDQLYRTVLDRVVSNIDTFLKTKFGLPGADREISREQAREILVESIEFLVEGLNDVPPRNYCFAKIHMFELLNPSPFYDEFYEKYFKPYYELWARIIMILTDSEDFPTALLQATIIFGQCASFRLEREMLVRRLEIVGFTREESEIMKNLVISNTFAFLGIK